MKRPRILLADDDTLVLEGFRKLLEPRYEMVGAVQDGQSLLAAADKLRPDLILLDISMPVLNGIEAARHLKKALPKVKLMFLTVHAQIAYVSEAFRVGASGYLLKRSNNAELTFAIQEVLQGRCYVTSQVTKGMVDSLLQASPRLWSRTFHGELTPRQRQTLQLVAEGHSTKEIASLLKISVRTAEFHKKCIKQALGVRTTAELTQCAIEEGLIGL